MRVVHLFVWILALSIAGSVSTAVAQNKSPAPSGSQATGIAPVSSETRSLAEQRTRARTQLKDAISGDNNTWVAAERAHQDLLKSAHRSNDHDAVGDAITGLIALYLSAPSQLSAPQLFAKVHAATEGVPIPKSAQQLLAKSADAIYSTTVRFAEAGAGPYRCRSEAKPAVRVLLVGNKSYTNRKQPLGPFNDVEVVKGALEARGVKQIKVVRDASRDRMVSEMKQLVADANCGDSVVFHFSGIDPPEIAVPGFRMPTGWYGGLATVDSSNDGWESTVWNVELSQFITAIRNKGAHAFLFLDAGAHVKEVSELQDRVAPLRKWTGNLQINNGNDSWRFASESSPEGLTPLSDQPGDYALYDPSSDTHRVLEVLALDPMTKKTVNFGALSLALSRAMQSQERPNVRSIAGQMAQEFEKFSNVSGQLVTSNPRLDVLSPGYVIPEQLDLKIISPAPIYGKSAFELKDSYFELVAQVPYPARVLTVRVDEHEVTIDAAGQFVVPMALRADQEHIVVSVLYSDRIWRSKKIAFSYLGDVERMVLTGNRYALVIGINNYANRVWNTLATPHNDVQAIAKVLKDDFGFRTNFDGQEPDTLVLLDPTLSDIQSKLFEMQKRLTDSDSLIIYYAGHGNYYEQTGEAYWIPRDGAADNQHTWLSASNLVSSLRLIQARSVLVVSDSCFSGRMRAPAPGNIGEAEAERRRALLASASRPSRIVIASGGKEPVLDQGCPNHSIFACAFLQGLRSMKSQVFSSADLFNEFLFSIGGRASQQPQHNRLPFTADVTGDFVFAKTSSPSRK